MKISAIACAALLAVTGKLAAAEPHDGLEATAPDEGLVAAAPNDVMDDVDLAGGRSGVFQGGVLNPGGGVLIPPREPEPEPPREQPSRFVFATAIEIEQEENQITQASFERPDTAEWEYVGKRRLLGLGRPRDNYDSQYFRRGGRAVLDQGEQEQQLSPVGQVDLAEMGLPDGRNFRQKPEAARRPELRTSASSFQEKRCPGGVLSNCQGLGGRPNPIFTHPMMRGSWGTNSRQFSFGDSDTEEESTSSTGSFGGGFPNRQVVGDDNRSRSVTASKPGIMVRIQSSANTTWGFCSGSMISPRVILTAAHCLTDINGDWNFGPTYIVPAARGTSYASNKQPQGSRRVERFIKPSGWKGSGVRYDYALLVIEDLPKQSNWDPKPISFGFETDTWLESQYFNLRGYPGGNLQCDNAARGDNGLCNGYAYYQNPAKKLHQAYSTWILHELDTQGGESGSGLYHYQNGVRTVYAIHTGISGEMNIAHRIRSGSFGLMCAVVEKYPSSHFPNFKCSEE